MSEMVDETNETPRVRRTLGLRVALGVFLLASAVLIWLSNLYFTDRFSQDLRKDAEAEMALYVGRIVSELQRNSVVPLLLSRDTQLIAALNSGDHAATSQRLISYRDEIGAKSIVLLDKTGRVVATTDRRKLGTVLRNEPYFVEALRASGTVFTTSGINESGVGFTFSRKLVYEKEPVGVILVEVDLDQLFDRWAGRPATIFVTDSEGRIILSTQNQFRHMTVAEALANQPAPSTVERAWRATGDWSRELADAYIQGRAILRIDQKIPFHGWTLTYLATFDEVRERVNAVLALELMGLAILTALGFYILSRRAIRRSFLFQAESRELRALNRRLQREIAERERVERSLEVAEQSLAQSSKLAALGEMSAAVSHELNQPLAAMRTYLAGARLLLQRNRPVEAVASLQRIDDLIDRMGAITRQLKSYARKGSDERAPVDLRDCVMGALSMMSPQLSRMQVHLTRTLPPEPVVVMGDRVRIEQVIVNLLRNALDAMKEQEHRELDILLTHGGGTAKLAVRDNGPGIKDFEHLFEPFYTTKKPGEGVGLGLAISSDIARDLGGRLLARNAADRGAVFEFWLPELIDRPAEAAE